jgi:hypothetical protein
LGCSPVGSSRAGRVVPGRGEVTAAATMQADCSAGVTLERCRALGDGDAWLAVQLRASAGDEGLQGRSVRRCAAPVGRGLARRRGWLRVAVARRGEAAARGLVATMATGLQGRMARCCGCSAATPCRRRRGFWATQPWRPWPGKKAEREVVAAGLGDDEGTACPEVLIARG